jgi:hypothetical protein
LHLIPDSLANYTVQPIVPKSLIFETAAASASIVSQTASQDLVTLPITKIGPNGTIIINLGVTLALPDADIIVSDQLLLI